MQISMIRPLSLADKPQNVFLRLKQAGLSQMVLLETVQLPHSDSNNHSKNRTAWSYIAGPAIATLQFLNHKTHLYADKMLIKEWSNPFEAIRELLHCFHIDNKQTRPSLPQGLQFTSGLVGYLGYDLIRLIEHLPDIPLNDTDLPDLHLYVCDHVLAYNEIEKQWYFCTSHFNHLFHYSINTVHRQSIWDNTVRLAHIDSTQLIKNNGISKTNQPDFSVGKPTFKTSSTHYLKQINQILDYIKAGDILQANLSHRIDANFSGDSFALYQSLTCANPAPYSAYIETEQFTIASVSPEQFLALDQKQIVAKPIKGTKPRAIEDKADYAAKKELYTSIKDRAENVMIVDLMRNDIGRVADIGSVAVKKLFDIEPHPSVWQMVSTIIATLKDSYDSVHLIQSCWPPGSMTGAPKIRAMEIIDSIEPVKRGIYSGVIGYFDRNGSVDLSVVIRTAVIINDRISVQVGGAIVADSDPHTELNETYLKGKKIFEVFGWNI